MSADLATRLSLGEPSAFEQLYDEFGRRAFGLAYRIVRDDGAAADVVQESFVALWTNRDRLDSERGNPGALLLTVVHRKAIDAVRARTRRTRFSSPLDVDVVDHETSAAMAVVVDRISQQAAVAALKSLPPDQREAVELAYFEGLTQNEVAVRLNLPLGTVKSRLRLALGKLRGELRLEDWK